MDENPQQTRIMAKSLNNLLVFILIAIILFSIMIRFASLSKDITAEESDFVKPAKAIVETGHPRFYHSGQQPNELALWHPPMYIYTLSLAAMLSTSEWAFRFPNVLAILLTAILIYLFSKDLLGKKEEGKSIGLLAAALFLVSYYVISSSLLIDIDAFSTLFVFAFIYFTMQNYQKRNLSSGIFAAGSLLLAFANRYPIAILVYSSIFVYLAINKERRSYLLRYFSVGVLAASVFLAIWTFYSLIIEPGNFFSFIKHNAQLGSEQFKSLTLYLASFFLNIAQFIRLFTLPAVIAFILSLFYFFKTKETPIKIISIYTLASLALFIIVPRPAFGYPRYFLTAAPGFFMLVSLFVHNSLKNVKIKSPHLVFAALCFIASLILLVMLAPQQTLYQSDGLIRATNLPDFALNLLSASPLLFVFLFRKNNRKIAFVIGLMVVFLSYNLYFDINYALNESHIKEVGKYLEAHTTSSDIIISPKAVGYYANRPFYVNDYTRPQIDKVSLSYISEYISRSIDDRTMHNEFFWENGYFGGINPPAPDDSILQSAKYVVLYHKVDGMAPEEKIGDFYIYNLNKQLFKSN